MEKKKCECSAADCRWADLGAYYRGEASFFSTKKVGRTQVLVFFSPFARTINNF